MHPAFPGAGLVRSSPCPRGPPKLPGGEARSDSVNRWSARATLEAWRAGVPPQGVDHEDPGLCPARTRARAREACALADPPCYTVRARRFRGRVELRYYPGRGRKQRGSSSCQTTARRPFCVGSTCPFHSDWPVGFRPHGPAWLPLLTGPCRSSLTTAAYGPSFHGSPACPYLL